jgi:uncharacterized membrane protein YqjE
MIDKAHASGPGRWSAAAVRITQVFVSYGIATLAGSFGLSLMLVLFGQDEIKAILGGTLLFAFFATIFSALFVLPVLIVTEIKRYDDWRFYVAACAIAAPLIIRLIGFEGILREPEMLPLLALCGAIGGTVYWFIAWRVFAPKPLAIG